MIEESKIEMYLVRLSFFLFCGYFPCYILLFFLKNKQTITYY
jgi:hypothetical protein